MAAPWRNGFSHFSLLAAKFMCAPGAIKAEQNDTPTKDEIPRLESENTRESILDFTVILGKFPRHTQSLKTGHSGQNCRFCLFTFYGERAYKIR